MKRLVVLILFTVCLSAIAVAQGRPSASQASRYIQGEVWLPDGKPVGMGAYVSLESDASGGFLTSQTDSRGKFSFTGLANVRYRVRVRAPGFEEETQEVDLSTNPVGYLRMTLRPKPESTAQPISGITSAADTPPADMPADAKKEYQQGLDNFTDGKPEKSIPHFKKSAEKYDKFAPTFYYLGNAYAMQKKFDEAIPALQKSIALNEKAPEAYISLGACYNKQKNFPEAEKALTKGVELAPESFDAHEELAKTYFASQKLPEAEQQLTKALALKPDSVEAHILMGNLLLRKRDNAGALKEYKESLRLDPNGPLAEPTKQIVAKIENALKAQNK